MNMTIVINLIPQCVKCGASVSDSIEPEVEKKGQLKAGRYVDNKWICNDCLALVQQSTIAETKNDDGDVMIGKASPADVSPNTPRADEDDI
jgi:hypothetical protein